MNNRIVVSNQQGQVIIPAGKFGEINTMFIAAKTGATYVALYEGATATAANILSIHKVAANLAEQVHDARVQFSDAGVYALVDANTEVLIVWGEWGGAKAAAVLSGG